MRCDGLTQRQLEVAQLVADGLTDKQIAAALKISKRAANAHVQRIALTWRLDASKDLRVQISKRASFHFPIGIPNGNGN